MTYLLDVNVLVALAWPAHVHHRAAHVWWAGKSRARWATCAVTQLGFVRVSSNPAFSPDALSPTQALEALEASTSHASHEFLAELPEAAGLSPALRAALKGHQQVTDAYLLALSARHKARLVTFDAGIASLAKAAGLLAHVEVAPA